MYKCFILFCFSVLISACHTSKQNKAVLRKTCLEEAIRLFSELPCETGRSVKEYTFQNKRVYVFDQSSCGGDMTSEVTDENCKSLGYLGGMMGNTEINGEDFSNAVFNKTIWKN